MAQVSLAQDAQGVAFEPVGTAAPVLGGASPSAPAENQDLAIPPMAIAAAQSIEAPPVNPVADVQAKLRAAFAGASKPSRFSDVVFKFLTALAISAAAMTGVLIGIACVLTGFAIYMFPITSISSLTVVAAAAGWIVYKLRRPKSAKAHQIPAMPAQYDNPAQEISDALSPAPSNTARLNDGLNAGVA